VGCSKPASRAYLGGWHGFDVDEGHGFSLLAGDHQAVLGSNVDGLIFLILVRGLILALWWSADGLQSFELNPFTGVPAKACGVTGVSTYQETLGVYGKMLGRKLILFLVAWGGHQPRICSSRGVMSGAQTQSQDGK
jgi:hypothetical protein